MAPEVASCYALLEAESADAATQIRLHLEQSNVDTRLWYGEGLQGHDCYRDLPRDSVDVTQSLAPRLIGLPMACDLTADAIERVVATIGEAVAHE